MSRYQAPGPRCTGRPLQPSHGLAPPWASTAIAAALLIGGAVAALVWHSDRLGWLDRWVLREIPRHSHGYLGFRVASVISAGLPPLVVGAALTATLLSLLVLRRRDAVILSAVAPPATLAAGVVLKHVVARRWSQGSELLYPSGHLAMATTIALVVVLVTRVAGLQRPLKAVVTAFVGLFVLVMAWARLTETVHSLSDVVGGIATGATVTLGVALALSAWPPRRPGVTKGGLRDG